MVKAKPKFLLILSVVSILGFLAMALEGFGITSFGAVLSGLSFIVVGIGLAIVGGIKKIFSYTKGGLTSIEVTHILSVMLGIVSVFVGVFTFSGLNSQLFSIMKAWLSIFMIIFIIIQTWFVE